MTTVISPFIAFAFITAALLAGPLAEDFWAAARKGDVEAVKALLAKGADVNAKTEYGATALSFAADKGHTEIARILIRHKADVNVKDKFYQASPVFWALAHGHAGVIK